MERTVVGGGLGDGLLDRVRQVAEALAPGRGDGQASGQRRVARMVFSRRRATSCSPRSPSGSGPPDVSTGHNETRWCGLRSRPVSERMWDRLPGARWRGASEPACGVGWMAAGHRPVWATVHGQPPAILGRAPTGRRPWRCWCCSSFSRACSWWAPLPAGPAAVRDRRARREGRVRRHRGRDHDGRRERARPVAAGVRGPGPVLVPHGVRDRAQGPLTRGSSRQHRLTTEQTRVTRPLRSTRITGLHHYYETVRPRAPRRYAAPCGVCRLGDSLSPPTQPAVGDSVGATGSHVPCKSQDQARAAYMPDAIWAVNRLPPDLSRDPGLAPVSTPLEFVFDTSSAVRSRSPS